MPSHLQGKHDAQSSFGGWSLRIVLALWRPSLLCRPAGAL